MELGLHVPGASLEYYQAVKEEGLELKEEWDKIVGFAEELDHSELVKRYHQDLDDVNLAKCLADIEVNPRLNHDLDWSRLLHGKIYKDGYFGEKMIRAGEWKDYRFGKNRKKMEEGWKFGDDFNRNLRWFPTYDFIKAQKLPHAKEDLHMRYMRRFSLLSRDNTSLRLSAARYGDDGRSVGVPGGKKRLRKGELPKLHPRVEEALSIMFEDMARTREFKHIEDDEEY